MMKLLGLHLLLTYKCNYQCDHCFVWGSPSQCGTMSLEIIDNILQQAKELDSIRSIYFEGGEPMLYYPILLTGVQSARKLGFSTGIVTNGYWASNVRDAITWLHPFSSYLDDLSVSIDSFHSNSLPEKLAEIVRSAAGQTDIPIGFISIAEPPTSGSKSSSGQLPDGESDVMYRGRAAIKLAPHAPSQPWNTYTECPYENMIEPGRVHIDPLGNIHICQGISIGNMFQTSLSQICKAYHPENHPITGPLLKGGPAELVRLYGLPNNDGFADACHLCYTARAALRNRFPEVLSPDQVYGKF
jgi:hypothetical protein